MSKIWSNFVAFLENTNFKNKNNNKKQYPRPIFLKEKFGKLSKLKIRTLKSSRKLLIVLVSLTATIFSEKCLLPINGYMVLCPTQSKNLERTLILMAIKLVSVIMINIYSETSLISNWLKLYIIIKAVFQIAWLQLFFHEIFSSDVK